MKKKINLNLSLITQKYKDLRKLNTLALILILSFDYDLMLHIRKKNEQKLKNDVICGMSKLKNSFPSSAHRYICIKKQTC